MPEGAEGRQSLGYALGGGGARGLSHIGVLKVLEEHGLYPDVIAGTSIGALVGALYASGMRAGEMEDLVVGLDWRRWSTLFDLALPVTGIIQGRRVSALLRSALGEMTFSQAAIRLACVATDLMTGEEVVFKRGVIRQAVLASMSVPGVLPPTEVKGRLLVDGGVVAEVPVKVCRSLGATYVIGVNVVPDPARVARRASARASNQLALLSGRQPKRPAPRKLKLPDIMVQTILIFQHRIALENMKNADLVISPEVESLGFWHFHRASEAIALGEAAARKALSEAPYIKQLLKGGNRRARRR